ncbi:MULTISPECIES: ferredoxin [Clostridium]|uniref:Ferredoxin n=1 Tax=Clostridium cibarium TaxID=2762247 RepID=A0ABR8PRY3_9CLOT|nr:MULTISPECIES: ferredoxin [Clostridium]MBD7910933.1 ferredoxin [Clostridium cibarium]
MKAKVDQEACVGCGLCPSICEEVFQLGDDGKAHAIVDTVPANVEDAAKDAESSCPVDAIECE